MTEEQFKNYQGMVEEINALSELIKYHTELVEKLQRSAAYIRFANEGDEFALSADAILTLIRFYESEIEQSCNRISKLAEGDKNV